MAWSIVSHLRSVLTREKGTIIKDWGGKMPIALAFPNVYHAGMSNLGFQAVYGLFNAHNDVVCERFLLPEPNMAAEYFRTGTTLLSLESQRRLTDFEFIAFSLSHENDYPGVLRMLRMGGLPVRREERGPDDPLVMAGGLAMKLNPEPLADFLDLILIGDGEIIVPHLLTAWREVRSQPLPKKDRTLRLARSIPGAYAPAFYEAAHDREGRLTSFEPTEPGLPAQIKPAQADELPDPALSSLIITPDTEFADTVLVEIGRGCARGCRFCAAGYTLRPPRSASVESVLAAAGNPEFAGARIGLISPAVADHPGLEDILHALTGQGREVTVSSLRVEALTPSLVEALRSGKLRSAAVAPEAGSEELRTAINKGLNEKQILDGVLLLSEVGVKRLKLYFMLGLPGETRDDVRAIGELVRKIKDHLTRSTKGRQLMPELTLTISSFVPKASTPFQAEPMCGIKELKARARSIQNDLGRVKGVRVHFDVPKWAYLQTLLSRGDRSAGLLLEALDRLDGSLGPALKEIPFNPDFFVTRSMAEDALLPWSFINLGFKKDYLRREMARAVQGKTSPPCRPDTCRICGICGGSG